MGGWAFAFGLRQLWPSFSTRDRWLRLGCLGLLMPACAACLCLTFAAAALAPRPSQGDRAAATVVAATPVALAPADSTATRQSLALQATAAVLGTELAQTGRAAAPAATEPPPPALAATPTVAPTEPPTPAPTPTPADTAAPAATATREGEQAGLVTRVIDGDTIDVAIAGQTFRVRYIGVNTPESNQACFSEAATANAVLVAGQAVRLVKDVSETDRYGRLLRYVYVGDLFVNAELVRQGYAEAVEYPPDTAQAAYLENLEQQARSANLNCHAAGAFAGQAAVQPTQPVVAPTQPASLPTPPPAQPPSSPADVQITFILADGAVHQVESDEYVIITNRGGTAVNLAGWRLNAGDDGQDFVFPSFDLPAGQACRVYTDEYHPESCGFSFGIGRAIWNNRGDCGHLYDAAGVEVSTYCY